ncbi:hypothetical protein AVEN_134328-1 [Araneus ventricosus]|uniref:Uncharacterized protein n=1 Tax=Araneus ventricosus TaxID=182803 RepID=A0A4Y2NUE8_ARAVE|nr:hypothetical protein AVEN_134328-1 [Araneus ventricosus]
MIPFMESREKACSKSYGPNAEKPNLSEQEFQLKRQQLLNSLRLSSVEAAALERATTEQKSSRLWREELRKWLTTSDFGVVCCRKESTSCQNIVKNKYSHFLSAAMKYDQDNEDNAVRVLQESFNLKVWHCGLFVNWNIGYLVASPDGLIDDGIVEVKCPALWKDLTPDESIRMKFFSF